MAFLVQNPIFGYDCHAMWLREAEKMGVVRGEVSSRDRIA